jgi:ADP-heptose:LPS heptosyltransferase
VTPVFAPAAAALRRTQRNGSGLKSPWLRAGLGLMDAVATPFLRGPVRSLDWSKVERVAVLRMDHLGDLLLALPALRRLRQALPKAGLDLWVGPWGEPLAQLFRDVDAVRVTPAPWFRRPCEGGTWRGVRALAQGLRREGYQASLDLRGDLRHHLAAWMGGVGLRAGHTITGGACWLTHPAQYRPGIHESLQAMAVLDAAGLPSPAPAAGPYLRFPARARAQAQAVARRLGLGTNTVWVQAASAAAAKRWPPQAWAQVLKGLPRGLTPCLLGAAHERGEMEALAVTIRKAGRAVTVATGELDLPGLAALLPRGRAMLSVDSGPAHLAAALGLPVLCLFSGTNLARQWAPAGPRVKVLQAQGIPCSPCQLSDCPYDNACMRAIAPAVALVEVRRLLGRPK